MLNNYQLSITVAAMESMAPTQCHHTYKIYVSFPNLVKLLRTMRNSKIIQLQKSTTQ